MNISQFVLSGFLNNRGHYRTHGKIRIAGWKEPLFLELTGDCSPDLKGKAIAFKHRPKQRAIYRDEPKQKLGLNAIQYRQIGPTGSITADGWARTFECTMKQFIHRASLGEAPPTRWQRRLTIEWFGQNGRILIEIADPILSYLAGMEGEEEIWKPLPGPEKPMPGGDPDRPHRSASGPEIVLVRFDGKRTTARRIDPDDPDTDDPEDEAAQRLDRELARRNRELDSELEDDPDRAIAEAELLDDLLENETPEPLLDIFGEPRRLPREETLDDGQAEIWLKSLLAQLALFHVTIDVCEHFTPRQTYRWLVEEILIEEGVHPELVGTGWATHFSTYESCKACEEKFEQEYAEREGTGDKYEEEPAED